MQTPSPIAPVPTSPLPDVWSLIVTSKLTATQIPGYMTLTYTDPAEARDHFDQARDAHNSGIAHLTLTNDEGAISIRSSDIMAVQLVNQTALTRRAINDQLRMQHQMTSAAQASSFGSGVLPPHLRPV